MRKFRFVGNESSRARSERELRLCYFGHVFADYHRLDSTKRQKLREDLPHTLQTLVAEWDQRGVIGSDEEDNLDWSDIAMLEDKILTLDDDVTLRRRAWQTRARYALLVGTDGFHKYLASNPPNEGAASTPVDALRADLRGLLGTTHFRYSLEIVRENNRRRIMWKVLAWTAVLCVASLIAAGVLLGFADKRLAGTLLLVTLFGCLGAYLSVQRRLQEAPDAGDPVISILGLYEFNSIQPFPLIAGGLFAIVLYYVIGAGFMTGDLFPVLGTAGFPESNEAWAKLFIWSLIAGFAERLVPDTLDRLTNQARPKGDTTVVSRSVEERTVETQKGDTDAAKAAVTAELNQAVNEAAQEAAATGGEAAATDTTAGQVAEGSGAQTEVTTNTAVTNSTAEGDTAVATSTVEVEVDGGGGGGDATGKQAST